MSHASDDSTQGTTASGEDGFVFAHLTDLHLTSLASARARELVNKRVLGYLSWRRKRRHIHRREVLDRMTADIATSGAQHIAITGDLTHVGLPDECEAADAWLNGLGDAEKISLVPGNHDRYVGDRWDVTVGRWERFMASDDHDGTSALFPALRVRGPVAFIGLSSSVATPPLMATGELGAEQRERCAELLAEARRRDLCRVVLIHHSPVPGGDRWRKRLRDASRAAAMIRAHGAELVLHGHTHRLTAHGLPGPDGTALPVVGLSSASAAETAVDRMARYSLWSVRRDGSGFTLAHRSRVFDAASGAFREDERWDPLAGAVGEQA